MVYKYECISYRVYVSLVIIQRIVVMIISCLFCSYRYKLKLKDRMCSDMLMNIAICKDVLFLRIQ